MLRYKNKMNLIPKLWETGYSLIVFILIITKFQVINDYNRNVQWSSVLEHHLYTSFVIISRVSQMLSCYSLFRQRPMFLAEVLPHSGDEIRGHPSLKALLYRCLSFIIDSNNIGRILLPKHEAAICGSI